MLQGAIAAAINAAYFVKFFLARLEWGWLVMALVFTKISVTATELERRG